MLLPPISLNPTWTGPFGGFGLRANGVTRFALTQTGIQSVQIPLPPLPEQRAKVRYLNHTDRRSHRYMSGKRKLISVLEEEKQAIIN